jgi:hypothetical protein
LFAFKEWITVEFWLGYGDCRQARNLQEVAKLVLFAPAPTIRWRLQGTVGDHHDRNRL